MYIIGTIIIGLIVGFLARALKPGDDKLGWTMTAILGRLATYFRITTGTKSTSEFTTDIEL